MAMKAAFRIRFCVGEPDGLQSGEWRIWSDPGKSDVYLAIRSIAGITKISLHASGACNASLTKQYVEAHPSIVSRIAGNRHLDQWSRSTNTGHLLSIPLRIRFLPSELRPACRTTMKQKKMVWLPSPPPDHSLDVICNFISHSLESGDWPWRKQGGQPIGVAELPNGETFWAIALVYPTPPDLHCFIEEQRQRVTLPQDSRLLIGETGPGNIRILTDAAATSTELPR